jgi:phytanoyl-CoA dioxygenase PhyH
MSALRSDQAQQFVDLGYAHLSGWLSDVALGAVRDSVIEVMTRTTDDESCTRPNNTLVPLRWNDGVVAQMLGNVDGLRRLSETVGATDLRWISGYVSTKEPHSPPLWWHQDWWCWDHPVSYRAAPSQVALLCYLVDTSVDSGALRVLPGSHTRSTPLHAALPEAHASDSAALAPNHVAMSDHPEQATLSVQAGDVVVTDYRLLHGTHANTTDHRRDCVLLSFTPEWANLPGEVRGHLISHPALPRPDEVAQDGCQVAALRPSYDGPRADLPLNRNAPADFRLHVD